MKSNMKRFLGILLAALMVVTMLPVTAFAEDAATVPAGASFVVGDKTFILMDTTKEINGKTYYGVLSKEKVSNTWYHATAYLKTTDGVIDASNEVVVNIMDDRQYDFTNKTIADSKLTNIQSFVTKFDAFGDYIAPSDTVWDLYGTSSSETHFYTKGSVGVPTSGQLKAILAKDELPFGGSESSYQTYSTGFWSGAYYWARLKNDGSGSNANWFINNTCHYSEPNGFGGTWYFMTYVSEDFFKNTHIALETMAADVRAMLKDNFNTLNLAPAGYTEAELDELGIEGVPCPEGNTFEAGGQTYIMLSDTLVANGKKHYAVMNTDALYAPNSYGTIEFIPNSDSNETTKYMDVNFNVRYGLKWNLGAGAYSLKSLEEVYFPSGVFGDYVVDGDWSLAKGWKWGDATFDLNYKGKIRLPSQAMVIEALGKGLVLPANAFTDTIVYFARDNYTYMAGINTAGAEVQMNKFKANNDLTYTSGQYGCYNAVAYLSEDFFLDGNVEISTMAKGVRDFLAANYYDRDFNEKGYNEYELDEIGIKAQPDDATTVLSWSPNYVKLADGTELLLNGQDGDYLNFMIATDYAGTSTVKGAKWGKATADAAGNPIDGTVYGKWTLMGIETDLDTYVTAKMPKAITDNLVVREWEGGLLYTLNLDKSGIAKSKAYFVLPSEEEILVHASYLNNMILDNTSGIANIGQALSKYNAILRTASGYSVKGYDAQDGQIKNYNGGVVNQEGSVFPTFYVHKDMLTEIKVDFKSLGANVKALFPANFVKNDFEVAYTDEEFEFLGVKAYYEEVKPEAGTSNSFVVGGENYLISSNIVEENGKKYFLVMNSTHLATDQGPYGRIEESVFDSEASTDTIKIFSDFKLGANYGNLEKTPTQKFKAGTSMADEYQDIYFPSSVFGNNLKMHDWQMATGWTWSDGNLVDVYHRAYMGLPTVAEVNAFNAIDPLSTQYTVLVETRKFTDDYNWKRMHLANLDGGATSSGSIVGADNFAYKENGQGKFFFVAYVSEDFFKGTDIDMTTAGDGFKRIIKSNFKRNEMTGWTKANLDILFGGYDGEGLGLEVAKTANGAEVIVHNNGTEATDEGLCLIVASYDANGLVDVKTVVLEESISAGAKTSAIKVGVDVAGATEVKAMLWDNLISAKPVTKAVSAN